jgi:hypothetical protein
MVAVAIAFSAVDDRPFSWLVVRAASWFVLHPASAFVFIKDVSCVVESALISDAVQGSVSEEFKVKIRLTFNPGTAAAEID